MARPRHPEPALDLDEVARADIPALRETMRRLGVIVAEVDPKLRYVWIDNPHHDFDSPNVVGKRDDQLIPPAEAHEIMQVKRDALKTKQRISRVLAFARSDGPRHYHLIALPIVGNSGAKVEGLVTLGFETALSGSAAPRR